MRSEFLRAIFPLLSSAGLVALLSHSCLGGLLTPQDLGFHFSTSGGAGAGGSVTDVFTYWHPPGSSPDDPPQRLVIPGSSVGSDEQRYGGLDQSTLSDVVYVEANNLSVYSTLEPNHIDATAMLRMSPGQMGVAAVANSTLPENHAGANAFVGLQDMLLLAVPVSQATSEYMTLTEIVHIHAFVGGSSAETIISGANRGNWAYLDVSMNDVQKSYGINPYPYPHYGTFEFADSVDADFSSTLSFARLAVSDSVYQYYYVTSYLALHANAGEDGGAGNMFAHANNTLKIKNVTLPNGDSLESAGMVLQFASGFELTNPQAVPEPASLTLVGLGAFGLVAGSLRRRRTASSRKKS